MKLELKRSEFTDKSTIGYLHLDGDFFCYTLEDVVHDGPKVPGKTAIPYGSYQIKITYSAHFKRYMPEILNVPDFTGVRIHIGNDPDNTDGCVLVGDTKAKDWIGHSFVAFNRLFEKLCDADERGEIIMIEITKEEKS